jgi:GLPGLI family protein
MKKTVIAIAALMVTLSSQAQVKEGKVIYERKLNMHKRLGPENESMKNIIPEFNTSKMQLFFTADASLFKAIPEAEDVRETAGEQGERVVMRFNGGGDNENYKNYTTQKMIELRELGPKKYIIEDSLRKQSWKLSDETKTIKNYTCKKATTKNSQNQDVVAWYAEDISTPSGPEGFGGLPGLILEMDIDNAGIVFTALEITTSEADARMVKAPTNGKKITREEYQKMMQEQFGASPGGGPTIRIIRN